MKIVRKHILLLITAIAIITVALTVTALGISRSLQVHIHGGSEYIAITDPIDSQTVISGEVDGISTTGRQVNLQTYTDGGWTTLKKSSVSKSSTFSFSIDTVPGKQKYRVTLGSSLLQVKSPETSVTGCPAMPGKHLYTDRTVAIIKVQGNIPKNVSPEIKLSTPQGNQTIHKTTTFYPQGGVQWSVSASKIVDKETTRWASADEEPIDIMKDRCNVVVVHYSDPFQNTKILNPKDIESADEIEPGVFRLTFTP